MTRDAVPAVQIPLFDLPPDAPAARLAAAQRAVLSLDGGALAEVVLSFLRSRLVLREGGAPGEPAPGTLTLYRDRARVFAAWLRATGRRIDRLAAEDLHAWGALLLSRYSYGYARVTLQISRIALKALAHAGIDLVVPPLPRMQRRRAEHEQRTPPPWDQIRAAYSALLRQALGSRDRADLRLALAVSLLAHSGLRRAEALGATWGDLEPRPGWLLIRHGKGGRDRFVPLSPAAREVLAVLRVELRPSEGWPLIGTVGRRQPHPERPICRVRLWQLIRAWLVESGLPRAAACHILRHACASEMVRRGEAITTVRSILGHASSQQTLAYCSDPPEADRVAAVAGLAG